MVAGTLLVMTEVAGNGRCTEVPHLRMELFFKEDLARSVGLCLVAPPLKMEVSSMPSSRQAPTMTMFKSQIFRRKSGRTS